MNVIEVSPSLVEKIIVEFGDDLVESLIIEGNYEEARERMELVISDTSAGDSSALMQRVADRKVQAIRFDTIQRVSKVDSMKSLLLEFVQAAKLA